ncbi:MAG: hypothetical protein KKA90_01665 [Nanoarchaeota archaeon]|nr:hypothetical protein [Nanoarchaeota archaeon]
MKYVFLVLSVILGLVSITTFAGAAILVTPATPSPFPNYPPTTPTTFLCNGVPCQDATYHKPLLLQCAGSVDDEQDPISYEIEGFFFPYKDWWDQNFQYRKSVWAYNPSNSVLNVTVEINMNDTDFTEHAKSDKGDIRIVDNENQNELPYDLIEGNNRVRIQIIILPQQNREFYIYYGNPNALTTEQILEDHGGLKVVYTFVGGAASSCRNGGQNCWDDAKTHSWPTLIGSGGAFGDFEKSGTDPRPLDTRGGGLYWTINDGDAASWMRLDLPEILRIDGVSQSIYNDSRTNNYSISVANETTGPWTVVVPSDQYTKITTFDIDDIDAKYVLLNTTAASVGDPMSEELEVWKDIKPELVLGNEKALFDWNILGYHPEESTILWDFSNIPPQTGINLRCRASDPIGSNTFSDYFDANIDITTEEDYSPILEEIGALRVYENQTLSLKVNATDYHNDPLTYILDAPTIKSPFYFDETTGQLEWTPTFIDEGFYPVNFSVSDGAPENLVWESTNITVLHINAPPFIDPIGDKTILEGQPLTFQLSVNEVDNDSFVLDSDVEMVIPSATFDENSGIFSWTPNFVDYGDYNVTFSATDGQATSSETITISVADAKTANLYAVGAPKLGNTISLLASDPAAANQFYFVLLALGTDPGIPLGDGRNIPLQPDALFHISLNYPNFIGLSDSVGLLNEAGNAVVTWTIPEISALENKDVYIVLGTADLSLQPPKALISITDPIHLTLLP